MGKGGSEWSNDTDKMNGPMSFNLSSPRFVSESIFGQLLVRVKAMYALLSSFKEGWEIKRMHRHLVEANKEFTLEHKNITKAMLDQATGPFSPKLSHSGQKSIM